MCWRSGFRQGRQFLMFSTKGGTVKRRRALAYNIRQNGLIAIGLTRAIR
jgi:hypothetical protein